ncbi:MAG: hypothetical protein M3Q14_00970 [bacterium]|nr:hypothetical protein [bacterium]
MEKGFIYYAVGKNSVTNAMRSIVSLKNHMPDSEITLFTDSPSSFSNLNITVLPVSSIYSKLTRIELLIKTPYKATFYIDSDTYFQAPCFEIFDLLAEKAIAISYTRLKRQPDVSVPSDFPYFNSGVIGYRLTVEVIKLFNYWRKEMEKAVGINDNAKDEPVFRKVLYSLKTPIDILPAKYNFRFTDKTTLPSPEEAKILHSDLSSLAI